MAGSPIHIEYEDGWAKEPIWKFGDKTNLVSLLGSELWIVLSTA
jgi:hypothetical protein